MKQPKTTTGIKRKIVGGFLLLLTLIFLSVFSVIKLATVLAPPDPGISTTAIKLTLTSNLLSSLIEGDGQARAFINTGEPKYLEAFYAQQDKARLLIDSLERGSVANTNQFLRIIAVDSLMDLKETTYYNYFELRQSAIETGSIDFSQLTTRYKDTIITVPDKRIHQVISPEIQKRKSEKKKGFFPKIWESITGSKKSNDSITTKESPLSVKYDTVTTYTTKIRDNTLSQVKSQLRKYEQQKNLQKQLVAERELTLIQADQDIMNEIRAVLLLFEKEEINNALKETEKSHKLLDNLWITALILAGAGLLATIGFLIMIWKDLAKSAYYRKQSEEARSLAESLLKVKEQFLANMSHEIRTPLTSIIGFTERLTETPVSKEQSKYLRYISSSSEHLLELINDLLDFSRIDSGRLTLEAKTFNPEELFEEAFETLTPRAKDKGLSVQLRQDIPISAFIGDPLRLRQIVINLLSNSIKFTNKGKIILDTKAELNPDQKHADLNIRIADTGIGIPNDKLDYIFEEFAQVDHSITRRYGGSGLGLAITKKLVDLMHGTLSVTSREGQGTIFSVKLRLPVSDENVKKDITEKKKNDLSSTNILLAEDDPTTRLLLTEFLQVSKANVSVATDGAQAFQLFKEDPSQFQLIITDIQMPGMSGPELVNKIIEICRIENLNVPVIIGLTAHADNSEIEEYKSIGMDYLILKPFKNKDLTDILNSIPSASLITEYNNNSSSNEQRVNPLMNSLTLDLSGFKKFAGDNEDSLNRIIASLNENLEKTLDQMKIEFEGKNYQNLSVLAHRLQPNIKLLGATQTAILLREIEVICRNDNPDEVVIREKLEQTGLQIKGIRSELENTKA